MLNKLFLKYRTAIIGMFYIAFGLYSIYIIQNATVLSTKIFYGCLAILLLSVSIYSEYLRHLYNKAIRTLTMDVNPELARKQMDYLLKRDVLKAYKNSELIFNTLYASDMLEIEYGLNLLEKNKKFFHSSLDQLLIYHYSKFYLSFLKEDFTTTINEYSYLIRLKNSKVKGNKVSPLYNWEFINAIYQFARKNYKTSINIFHTINIKNMNHRELMHLYYQMGNIYAKTKDFVKALECYNLCIENCYTSAIKEHAINERRKLPV